MNLGALRDVLMPLCMVLFALPCFAGPERALSFDERTAAQRAIERVRHSHRSRDPRPFSEAVPAALVERQVRTYLAQSAAIERVAGRRITIEDLGGELRRILHATRSAERLDELFVALDRDPVLILECLVRPVLVRRLLEQEYFADPSKAGDSFESWWREIGPLAQHPVEDLASVGRSLAAAAVIEALGTPLDFDPACAGDDSWGDVTPGPEARSGHTAVWTGLEMIVWGGLGLAGPLDTGSRYDPVLDLWTSVTTLGAPTNRFNHTAVWTGTEMIVWGGGDGGDSPVATGARYDPLLDQWTPVTNNNAPSPREWHTAVWTDSLMMVWGGGFLNPPASTQAECVAQFKNTGSAYSPSLDSWSALPVPGSLQGRRRHSAVWTGTEMIVFGGQRAFWEEQTQSCNPQLSGTGSRYDPQTELWDLALPGVGSPAPQADHPAVWTDGLMIVWNEPGSGAYDPLGDEWSPVTSIGAPVPRTAHTLIWTGTEMVVWGGRDPSSNELQSGGRYDPGADQWGAVSTDGAPEARATHTSVWADDLMVVWGGSSSGAFLGSGGRYAVGRPDGDADDIADVCDACPADPDNDADSDTVCGDVDNCAAVPNPAQGDEDADGVGSLCDVCPETTDSSQIDTDGDGLGDECDCEANDPGDRAPAEVTPLQAERVDSDTIRLSWPPTPSADLYSVSRALLSNLAQGSYGDCIAEGLSTVTFDDAGPPPGGNGYAYLVQGQSGECGLGSLGFDTAESARVNTDAGACQGASVVDAFPSGETTVFGEAVGTFEDVVVSDDSYQTITEEETAGNPSNRLSRLEHHWTFTVPAGGALELHVEGLRTPSTDGDDFAFESSTDGGANWIPIALASLPIADDDIDLVAALPAVSVQVLVRVIDSDRTPGNTALDSVSLDQIYLRVLP